MKQILISDIFGITPELEDLSSKLPGNVALIDPYNGKQHGFENENDAYSHFSSQVGIKQYAETILSLLDDSSEVTSVIGFSAGASAVWKISDCLRSSSISRLILFYGSQIRHMTDIKPGIPTHLIFPVSEPHFDVADLITQLTDKENVTVEHTEFFHGFMNPHSQNFSENALGFYLNKLNSNHYP